jgi:hypothetical protein
MLLVALPTLLLGPDPHAVARLSAVTSDGPQVLWQADRPQQHWTVADQARLGAIHWRSGGVGLARAKPASPG